MSREIKFRCWDGEQMVSPDQIDRDGTAWWMENSIPTRSKIVMQYTGLRDKNGVEIYEGDILEDSRHEFFGCISGNDSLPNLRIVRWDDRTSAFLLAFADPNVKHGGDWPSGLIFCRQNCEKIFQTAGNIYEHPHLLKPVSHE